MGMYHSVSVTYGFEIPNTTDIDRIDQVIGDGPDLVKDSVGHIVVGDYDRLLLVTRWTPIEENQVVTLTPDALASPADVTTWQVALHETAVRIGHPDHAAPTWLLVHNYR